MKNVLASAKSKTRLAAGVMAVLAYLKYTGKVNMDPATEKLVAEMLLAVGFVGLRDALDKVLPVIIALTSKKG